LSISAKVCETINIQIHEHTVLCTHCGRFHCTIGLIILYFIIYCFIVYTILCCTWLF
jgi:hypothetical protein